MEGGRVTKCEMVREGREWPGSYRISQRRQAYKLPNLQKRIAMRLTQEVRWNTMLYSPADSSVTRYMKFYYSRVISEMSPRLICRRKSGN